MNLQMSKEAFEALPIREENHHRDPYHGELFRCNGHATMAIVDRYNNVTWNHFNVTNREQ